MIVCRTKSELSSLVDAWHRAGESVALVPTMGYLHEGHASLMRIARKQANHVVVSVFVNPTQFGPNEDFAQYPRDEKHDFELLEKEGVDAVLAPTPAEMYGDNPTVSLIESTLSKVMCGAFRPIHFAGVLTVCLKLIHIARADVAVFGQKDAQQLAILRRMVRDLDVPVKIVGAPLVREADGLALSSRNTYLSAEERSRALVLHEALDEAQSAFAAGATDPAPILKQMHDKIAAVPGTKIDYVVAVDADSLEPVEALRPNTLLALAVYVGKTRLIDNHIL